MIDDPEPVRWLRPAALLLFIGLPCTLAVLTIFNVLRWTETRNDLSEQSGRIAEYERRIRASVGTSVQALDTSAIYIGAVVPALARAELQTRVVDLVERSGARLIEVRADEDASGEDLRSMVVRATFDTVQGRLVDLLAAIEGSVPLLRVSGLDAKLMQRREIGPVQEDPPLRVSLAIRGYRKAER